MKSSRTARVALLSIVASLSLGGVAQAQPPGGDDDGDGVVNRLDPFALDPQNGAANGAGFRLDFNGDQGGFKGSGFSGLMTNGVGTFADDGLPNVVIGGGRLTINAIGAPDPVNDNSGTSFQIGMDANPARTSCFTVRTRVVSPFAGVNPITGFQSMGLFVGRGDQDHYAKLVVQGGYGRGIESFGEYGTRRTAAGALRANTYGTVAAEGLPGPDAVDLYFRVDPDAGVIEPFYRTVRGGVASPTIGVGAPLRFPDWFTTGPLAVGILSTSYVGGTSADPRANPFSASWEDLEVSPRCTRPTFESGAEPTASPQVAGDRTPPSITSARVVPSRFRATGRASRRGGTLRVAINEGSRLRVRIERLAGGRRTAGGRCAAPTRRNRSARRCTRVVVLQGALERGTRAGQANVRLSGRFAGRRLSPGRYRARVTGIDAKGNQSRQRTARFRVLR